jgi:maltooligosyltrehalose trehalohydrolase
MHMTNTHRLGASYTPDATRFRVWAPNVQTIELLLLDAQRTIPMQRDASAYFTCSVSDVQPGERYFYRLDGEKQRPDPASKSQPEGVHGPSQVVDLTYAWQDAGFHPPSLRNSVIYELHVGAFSAAGTFEGVIPHLPALAELGVTTLQLMPVAQFPGPRNWGYDGVQLYAPHADYGGARGLQRLVDACHAQGMAVYLDVVYNHLGPEGNYLWDYGPYFTDRYHSVWSDSVNLDGPHSDPVRRFFIENACYWFEQFHIDGLRLDATHALIDNSTVHFLEELSGAVDDWAARHDRQVVLIAENDRSDYRLTLGREANGFGMDAQWLDDLHHVLHVALTGEDDGYYADYQDPALLPKVLAEGFAYSGEVSPARQRRHGAPPRSIPTDRFVVSAQTHDQVGNRMLGERLTQLTSFDGLKLAAALLACSPYVPMLFMGEEYGEPAPFLFFVSHGDPDLVESVRKGRAEEFAAFRSRGAPPDPQDEQTFLRCKLDHGLRHRGEHALLQRIYGELLTLRRETPALTNPDRHATSVHTDLSSYLVCLERRSGEQVLRIFMNFDRAVTRSTTLAADSHAWHKTHDSRDPAWCPATSPAASAQAEFAPAEFAPGTPQTIELPALAFAIYRRQE